jgi:hypothetical protein
VASANDPKPAEEMTDEEIREEIAEIFDVNNPVAVANMLRVKRSLTPEQRAALQRLEWKNRERLAYYDALMKPT